MINAGYAMLRSPSGQYCSDDKILIRWRHDAGPRTIRIVAIGGSVMNATALHTTTGT